MNKLLSKIKSEMRKDGTEFRELEIGDNNYEEGCMHIDTYTAKFYDKQLAEEEAVFSETAKASIMILNIIQDYCVMCISGRDRDGPYVSVDLGEKIYVLINRLRDESPEVIQGITEHFGFYEKDITKIDTSDITHHVVTLLLRVIDGHVPYDVAVDFAEMLNKYKHLLPKKNEVSAGTQECMSRAEIVIK